MTDTLYDEDFVVWTERQADALRRAGREGSNLPIDFENLAEEVEDLGNRDRREVEGLVNATLVHLLMLAASPATDPRPKWRSEVDEFRDQIERVLRRNRSIARQMQAIVEDEFASAIRKAARRLRDYEESDQGGPVLAQFGAQPPSLDEVMGDGVYPIRGTRRFEQTS